VKAKINEPEANSRNKNIRDLCRAVSDFKRDYRRRTNRIKDENVDLVPDSRSILARKRNHFSQLLNVHGFNDVRQTEILTSQPLVPQPVSLSFR
jgi:hypothetical protein